MQLSTVVIDDEKHCIEHLCRLLEIHCPEISIQETCNTPEEGLEAIAKIKPDLLFLDVEMPRMTGFQLLKAVPQLDFHIVFTTAFQQYAVQAFKVSALDFLLKPVDAEELKLAISKAIKRNGELMNNERLTVALQSISSKLPLTTQLTLPHAKGYDFADAREILYCQAENGNIRIHFSNGKIQQYLKTLREMEEILSPHRFLQIHKDTVANLNEVRTLLTGDATLLMSNGQQLHIGKTYLNGLKKAMIVK